MRGAFVSGFFKINCALLRCKSAKFIFNKKSRWATPNRQSELWIIWMQFPERRWRWLRIRELKSGMTNLLPVVRAGILILRCLLKPLQSWRLWRGCLIAVFRPIFNSASGSGIRNLRSAIRNLGLLILISRSRINYLQLGYIYISDQATWLRIFPQKYSFVSKRGSWNIAIVPFPHLGKTSLCSHFCAILKI